MTLCTQTVLTKRYHQSFAFKCTQMLQCLSLLLRWNEQTHASARWCVRSYRNSRSFHSSESSNHIHVSRKNIWCFEGKKDFYIYFYTTASTFHTEIYYAGMKKQCIYLLHQSKWNDSEFGNVAARQLATRLIFRQDIGNDQWEKGEQAMLISRYTKQSQHMEVIRSSLRLCLEYG